MAVFSNFCVRLKFQSSKYQLCPNIGDKMLKKPAVKVEEAYAGFEQGPIRPPSEAQSLLVRITRNCPWNRCTFCPLYKGTRFSIRPVWHVKKDIDAIHTYTEMLRRASDEAAGDLRSQIHQIAENAQGAERQAFHAALNWYLGGMRSVFLQDANSLVIKPSDLVEILKHIKNRFPEVDRITSYARSQTIARIKDEDLKAIADAGLNRIHIGLESASDAVLKMVRKGATKAIHIEAGLKVKNAGMELSEYFMPGLGGRRLSKEHALETADALNQIDPDFIRLRTLAIPTQVPLFDDYISGKFDKCTDRMMVEEILLFLEHLSGITSYVKSDHILNLFEEVQGRLPEDKGRMLKVLRTFLAMAPDEQVLYQVGRRLGIFAVLKDLDVPRLRKRAEDACHQYGITSANADEKVDQLMMRFI